MQDDPAAPATPAPPAPQEYVRFLDESRADAAARARSRERWLRRQAAESASLAGLLLTAAEQSVALTVRTSSGRSYRGTVITVGADFCALVSPSGVETFLAVSAVTALRPEQAVRPVEAADDRPAPVDLRLAEALGEECADRPRVALVMAGDPEPVVGTLRTVGGDVATVQLEGRGDLVYVRLPSVTEVSFLASG